jgi:pimeloyl-ACP methyl ester carboxylesterase
MAIPLAFAWMPGWRWRFAAVPVALLGVTSVLFPAGIAVYISHAPRYEISAADLGRPYDDVSFETRDGLTIRAWYVPSTNGAAVMVLHGSGGARVRPVDHARMFINAGYGVLLFDVRGHGTSDGATNALGWGAWPDVEAAAEFLDGRDDVEDGRVGVMGVSMGAEVGLEAVTHITTVRAIVADGAGVRSINELSTLPFTWSRATEYPSYAVSNAVAWALSGESIPPEMADRVHLIDTPTLLISSNLAEERDINRIWHAEMDGRAELWELSDTGHTAGLREHPEEYSSRVIGFFDEHMLTP